MKFKEIINEAKITKIKGKMKDNIITVGMSDYKGSGFGDSAEYNRELNRRILQIINL